MRNRIKQFWALESDYRQILLIALVLLPSVELALRCLGFKRCYAGLSHLIRIRSIKIDSPEYEQQQHRARLAAKMVAIAARHGVCSGACLSRSLTLWVLLNSHAISGELCIGVQRDSHELKAHAWVEVDGVPVNDVEDIAQHFLPLTGIHQVLENRP